MKILFAILVLLFSSDAFAEQTAYFDWTNKIGRPVNEGWPEVTNHAYSTEEFEAAKGFDLYCWAGRPLFTATGMDNAREIAGDGKILAYVFILHTFLEEFYASSPWPWVIAQGSVLAGTEALDHEGNPSPRWKNNQGPDTWSYHVDPFKSDPREYAELVANACSAFGVDGIFIDYMAETPWNYPGDSPVAFDSVDLKMWQAYQVQFVASMRALMGPDFLLIANGRWANEQPLLTSPTLLSGSFWERNGSLWWTPEQFLERIKGREGIQIFGSQQVGPKAGVWNMQHLGYTAAVLEDQFWVAGGR